MRLHKGELSMRMRNSTRRQEDLAEETLRASAPVVIPAEVLVDRVLENIDCCLAEVQAGDDEAKVQAAFEELRQRVEIGEINYSELLDAGTLLKAQYAHTQYVQMERCCYCGCPWHEES